MLIIKNEALKIQLTVSDNKQIAFTVNGSYDLKKNNPNKIAITKWLLKELKKLKSEYTLLFCRVHKTDGKKDYRQDIYAKLGFVYCSTTNTMYWGTDTEELKAHILKSKKFKNVDLYITITRNVVIGLIFGALASNLLPLITTHNSNQPVIEQQQ